MKKLLLVLSYLVVSVTYAAGFKPVEGKDYKIVALPPTSQQEPGKVEVKEFFSFGCIHCKDVDPMVEEQLVPNKKVVLNRIQVVWNDDATIMTFAKLNATIQILGLTKLYTPTFNAVFNGDTLNSDAQVQGFLTKSGLTTSQVKQFMDTYNSFTVSAKVGQYKDMTKSYNITGTPTFIVANKYVVSPALPEQLIQVVQFLVNKASK